MMKESPATQFTNYVYAATRGSSFLASFSATCRLLNLGIITIAVIDFILFSLLFKNQNTTVVTYGCTLNLVEIRS